MSRSLPRSHSRAIVLLEVLVALAMLAGSGLVALSWVQQSLESASRVRRIQEESQLLRNAQAVISQVNPAAEPTGRLEQPGLRVEWTSKQLEPLQGIFVLALEGRLAAPPWRVGLFQLDVTVQPLATSGQPEVARARPVTFTAVTAGFAAARPGTAAGP